MYNKNYILCIICSFLVNVIICNKPSFAQKIGVQNDYQKACESGELNACNELGLNYVEGSNGYAQSFAKGNEYFKKSCNLKNGEACGYLGLSYFNGNGVKKSLKEAIKYFSKACELKDGRSCTFLGTFSLRGEGLKKSEEKAKEFYKKGCEFGSNEACVMTKAEGTSPLNAKVPHSLNYQNWVHREDLLKEGDLDMITPTKDDSEIFIKIKQSPKKAINPISVDEFNKLIEESLISMGGKINKKEKIKNESARECPVVYVVSGEKDCDGKQCFNAFSSCDWDHSYITVTFEAKSKKDFDNYLPAFYENVKKFDYSKIFGAIHYLKKMQHYCNADKASETCKSANLELSEFNKK